MKYYLPINFFSAALIALAATSARAEMTPVNLDLTFRNYTSLADATCTAHGDFATSHIGYETYSSINETYSSHQQGSGYYNYFSMPYGHVSAQANTYAYMTGYGGSTPGSATISASAGMGILEGSGSIILQGSTSANGNRDDSGWATAACSATIQPGGTLHIGASSEYHSGDALSLHIELECIDCYSWTLKVAGMEYNSCTFGTSLDDLITVYADMDTTLEFSCTAEYELPPGYDLEESRNCFVELTLVDEIPEPAMCVLVCTGLATLLVFGLRRRR